MDFAVSLAKFCVRLYDNFIMDIEVLYEDKFIAVVIKPAGIQSESPGMPELVAERCSCREVFCVHRLDKPVSGLMVYAKTRAAAASLSAQIASGAFQKEYLAVLPGSPGEDAAELCDLLYRDARHNKSYVVKRARRGVKAARLSYRVLERAEALALVSVLLHTGRTHQIRVQFASRALPLLGDTKYGSRVRDCPLALFSHALSFRHPASGEPMAFRALPAPVFPWSSFNSIDSTLGNDIY